MNWLAIFITPSYGEKVTIRTVGVCIDCVPGCPDVFSLSTKTNRYKANYTTGISLSVILYHFLLYLVKMYIGAKKWLK